MTVRLKVGFGDAGSDVPEDILQGLRMLAGHFLENREGVSMATAAEMPWGVKSMLRTVQVVAVTRGAGSLRNTGRH